MTEGYIVLMDEGIRVLINTPQSKADTMKVAFTCLTIRHQTLVHMRQAEGSWKRAACSRQKAEFEVKGAPDQWP